MIPTVKRTYSRTLISPSTKSILLQVRLHFVHHTAQPCIQPINTTNAKTAAAQKNLSSCATTTQSALLPLKLFEGLQVHSLFFQFLSKVVNLAFESLITWPMASTQNSNFLFQFLSSPCLAFHFPTDTFKVTLNRINPEIIHTQVVMSYPDPSSASKMDTWLWPHAPVTDWWTN